MNNPSSPRPLVVVILDGWGISFVKEGNAILAADTPAMDNFARYYPTAAVKASGIEVGLPWGEVGNSETGHRNIGAGQVQYQVRPTIDKAIQDKSFYSNETLLGAINHTKINNSNLHIMGMASSGGIHSHIDHLLALLKMCSENKLKNNVFLHLFTDGRDTPPRAAMSYLKQIEDAMSEYKVGVIASITGRFYAMDRNNNWDRTEMTYNTLLDNKRINGAPTARQAIEQAYQQDISDEMIPPSAITRGGGAITKITHNDAVIFFNFRPDRARQLTQAFVQPDNVNFAITPLHNLYFATLAEYDPNLPAHAAYVEEKAPYPLARILSEAGLKQFHIAETEKYAHITYYLNVGHEIPFTNEDHLLVRSSSVKNFADEPEMKASEITDQLLLTLRKNKHDIYFVNYANADMVGHTGDFEAAKIACSTVDLALNRLSKAVLQIDGALLITADHGNAEEMIHPQSGEKETDHTSNPVPLHYITNKLRRTTPKSDQEITAILSSPIGMLSDVAPTILEILNIPKPKAMSGYSLLSSLR